MHNINRTGHIFEYMLKTMQQKQIFRHYLYMELKYMVFQLHQSPLSLCKICITILQIKNTRYEANCYFTMINQHKYFPFTFQQMIQKACMVTFSHIDGNQTSYWPNLSDYQIQSQIRLAMDRPRIDSDRGCVIKFLMSCKI